MTAQATGHRPQAVEPEFSVLGVSAVRWAALPTLAFDLHVGEPSGRQVYAIALTAQLMIEPARRRYDKDAREKLVELFGPPERWSVTTRSLLWTQLDAMVPAFTGSTTFRLPVTCSYDHELVAAKYFHSLGDGDVPLAFNFNGTVYYRDDEGRLQMSLVPWSCSAEFRMPVSVWRDLIEHYYPNAGWLALHADTLDALAREKARRGLPTFDATVRELLG